jgi:hypothetical protein
LEEGSAMRGELVLDPGDAKVVTITRLRRATAAERRKDPEAKVMAENITIRFGLGEPKVTVNRSLCGDA